MSEVIQSHFMAVSADILSLDACRRTVISECSEYSIKLMQLELNSHSSFCKAHMVSSVIPLSAHTFDKQTVIQSVGDRATPAFTRETVDVSGRSDAKLLRSFGVQERPRLATVGFVRQAPGKTENKDGVRVSDVLSDIALQSRNSAGEFMGTITGSAPSLQQVRNAAELVVHGLNGAGAGAMAGYAWEGITGNSLPAELHGALAGTGAAVSTIFSPVLQRMHPAAPDRAAS
jgi:hypothetical protein